MIYVTHGVVHNWNPKRISHGLMLSETAVARYLQQRKMKYVSLTEALVGKGDALTVDDATYAGLRLALLARRYGHAVSWFVNGMHVERRLPYFPFQLSWMVDETQKARCLFHGQHWNLSHEDGRRALRLHLKHVYLRMSNYREIAQLIEMFSNCVEVQLSTLEKALCTVSSRDLAAAVDAGVELRNHGWSHLNPHALSERELTADVQFNEAYLSHFQRANARVFAPPFGRPIPLIRSVASFVLLADRSFAPDQQNSSFVNRFDLHLSSSSQSSSPNCERLAQTG